MGLLIRKNSDPSRQQGRDEVLVQKVRKMAADKGFDTSVLEHGNQTGCDASKSDLVVTV